MARGRKRNPTPDDPAGDQSAGYVPPMPQGMGQRAAAKWAALVPLIARQVSLKDVDSDAIRQYCEAVVLREKAVAELEGAPLLLAGPNGAEYGNPLLKVIKEAEAVMMRLSERFGLDPASRRRLAIESGKPDTAFAEFLKRGRSAAKPPFEA